MATIEVARADGRRLRLAFDDIQPPDGGEEPAVLLIHGFASSRRTNWIAPGWYRAFGEAGRRVIAFDHRGHGESDTSHDPADYDEGRLANDAAAVLAVCRVTQADVFGYSMGAMVAIRLASDHPGRVRRLILGRIGDNYFSPPDFADSVPDALLTDDPDSIADPRAKTFRTFADAQKQDRFALAACWRRARQSDPRAALAKITLPTLVIVGENDAVTGPAERLAAAIRGAALRIVPRRDHMTAVGDRVTKAEVLAFLKT